MFHNDGSAYDPAANSWSATSVVNAPSVRAGALAVWTGNLMMVWGGYGPEVASNTGSRYDPAADTWTAMGASNSPSNSGSAVWTGTLMIVWGGWVGENVTNAGGRYDPATDTWTPTHLGAAPRGRQQHIAVWTGTLMIVWGGYRFPDIRLNDGGRYDPMLDTWSPTSTVAAPSARADHTAVWTGSRLIVWGGTDGQVGTNSGGVYDPLTDSWTVTSMVNVPDARSAHTAVWTGTVMVVWGGDANGAPPYVFNTGGRYDPATDTWTTTSTIDAPMARFQHTAVWTGSRMIVWGGLYPWGGRYDPATDTWQPVSTINQPDCDTLWYSSVLTGSEMIVWGGNRQTSWDLRDGGRYNPLSDTWTRTSLTNAPLQRYKHTAVWTGSRMIVWGGIVYGYFDDNTGGLYDPVADTWSQTSTANSATGRNAHTAVWTGSRMVVWGGNNSEYRSYLSSGGQYALPETVDNDRDGYSICQGDCDDSNPGVSPGVMEACDGIDNNCDGTIDNALLPSSVSSVQVSEPVLGTARLTWSAVATATGYDVVRGRLAALLTSAGDFGVATDACLANDQQSTSSEDTVIVDAGDGLWYVVRAVNCVGVGTYDSGGQGQQGSRDAGIQSSSAACP